MSSKTSSQVFFWLVVAVIVAGVAFVINKGMGRGHGGLSGVVKIDGTPRNAAPVDSATRLFAKSSMPVRSGVVELDMTYYLFSPQKPWPEGVKFPMVVVLHGAPGNAYAAQHLLKGNRPVDYPAFIFVPVLPPGMLWYAHFSTPEGAAQDRARPKGLPGAMKIVDHLAASLPVDRRRIYVVGCSEGGIGAFGAAKHYSDVVAAAVSVSGAWQPEDAPSLLKTPMLVMHGGADSVFPAELSRNVSQAVKKLGGPLEYIEFPGVEHMCPAPLFYGEGVWRWLFGHKKAAPAPPAAR